MFDQTFVDGVGKTNKTWTVALSFALEFVAMGAVILIPLIWTGVLPKFSQWSMLTTPTPPPPPAPSQPARRSAPPVRRIFRGLGLQAPVIIPSHVAVLNDAPLDPAGADISDLGPALALPALESAATIGRIPVVQTPPPPPPVNDPPKPAAPLRQSSSLQAARCVSCPKPAYPPIAMQARIQGSVVLSAVIAKDGTVQKLTVVSSANPLLTPAALNAVKRWIYSPTVLNNEPVEVLTEININFALR